MGLSLGKQQRQSSPWPDLMPELLGLVLCRLLSHADRLSFMAVCHRWRLAAQQQHPLSPTLPCLCLEDQLFQTLPGGELRRLKFPDADQSSSSPFHFNYFCFDNWVFFPRTVNDKDTRRPLLNPTSRKGIKLPKLRFCPLSCFKAPDDLHKSPSPSYIDCFNNWILLFFQRNDEDDNGTSFLLNPSSRKTVRIPELRFRFGSTCPRKMIVCSPGLIVASSYVSNEVAFYRPGADVSWSVYPLITNKHKGQYADIVFHRGKLYVLTMEEELFVQGINDGNSATGASHLEVEHVIKARSPAAPNNNLVANMLYLVPSGDKLLMVKINCTGDYRDQGSEKVVFKVFEADLATGRWLDVKALDSGQALFVGRAGSKAVALIGHDEIFRWNRVYFTGLDLCFCLPVANKGTPSYGFYDLSNDTIGQVFLESMGTYSSQWFFHRI